MSGPIGMASGLGRATPSQYPSLKGSGNGAEPKQYFHGKCSVGRCNVSLFKTNFQSWNPYSERFLAGLGSHNFRENAINQKFPPR